MNNNEVGQKIWKDYIIKEILFTNEKKGVYKVLDQDENLSILKIYKVSLISETDDDLTNGVDFIDHLNNIKNYLITSIEKVNKLSENVNVLKYDDYAIRLDKKSLGFNVYLKYKYLKYAKEYFNEKDFTYNDLLILAINLSKTLVNTEKANIIHRNMNINKIFITDNNECVLGNFGIFDNYNFFPSNKLKLKYRLQYPPEKCKGEDITNKTDIYYFGTILYHFLYNGSLPIIPVKTPDSIMTMLEVFISQKLNELNINSDGDKSILKIMLKALSYEESKRYQSANELLTDLEYLYNKTNQDEKNIIISKGKNTKSNEDKIKIKEESNKIFDFHDDLDITKNFDIPKADLIDFDNTIRSKKLNNSSKLNSDKNNIENVNKKEYIEDDINDKKDYSATVVLDKNENTNNLEIENVGEFLDDDNDDIDLNIDEIEDLLKDESEEENNDLEDESVDISNVKEDKNNLDEDTELNSEDMDKLIDEEDEKNNDIKDFEDKVEEDKVEENKNNMKTHENIFDESNYFHSPNTLKKDFKNKIKKDDEEVKQYNSLIDEDTGKIRFLSSEEAGTVDEKFSSKTFEEKVKKEKKKIENIEESTDKNTESQLFKGLKLSDEEEKFDLKDFSTTIKHDKFFKKEFNQTSNKELDNVKKEKKNNINNKFNSKKPKSPKKLKEPKKPKEDKKNINNNFDQIKESKIISSNKTIKIIPNDNRETNTKKSDKKILVLAGVIGEGLLIMVLIAVLVLFADKIFISDKLVGNYKDLKFSNIIESESKTYKTESIDSKNIDDLYYLKKAGNYSKKITGLSSDKYLGVVFSNGNLYAKSVESEDDLIYIDDNVDSVKSRDEWLTYLKKDGKLYIKPEGMDSEIQLIGEDIKSYEIEDNRIVALKNDKKLVVKDGSWEDEWIEIAKEVIEMDGATTYFVSKNRISYINKDKVLYVKEGAADSKWKKISENVYSCRITDSRIAFQNYKYELNLIEGDIDGKVSKIADKVGSFRVNDKAVIYLKDVDNEDKGYDLMIKKKEDSKWTKIGTNILQAILEEDNIITLDNNHMLKISYDLDSEWEYETKNFQKLTPSYDGNFLVVYDDMTLFLADKTMKNWRKINVNY
jgi:hypothetical protein